MSLGDPAPGRCRKPRRYRPHLDRRRDEDQLPRLRHVGDRRAGAARRSRRAQAGSPADPLRLPGSGLCRGQGLSQVEPHRRRRDGQISSPRRQRDLRRARADDAGLVDARAADRRPGQFRLDGPRPPGRDALHRGAAGQGRQFPPRRHRQGHRRLHPQLRRLRARAAGASGALPQSARQWRWRDRGRDGDQHPAAQSWRSAPRLPRLHRRSDGDVGRADGTRQGPRLSDLAIDPRHRRDPLGLHHRARLDPDAQPPYCRGRPRRPPLDRADRHPLPGRQEPAGRNDRRGRQGQAHRRRQRHPRRIEPPRRPHRHRPQARRDARGRAQPIVAPHPGAIELCRQHAGDPRRAARDARAARHYRGVRQVPHRGDHPPLQI